MAEAHVSDAVAWLRRKVDAKKLVLTHFGGGFQTTSAKTADLANLGTTNDLTFPIVPDE